MQLSRVVASVALPLVFAAAGCGEGRAAHPDASSLFTCTSNADCDDHIACTVDNCDVSGTCSHTGVDSMCTAPERCMAGVGCTTTMTCTDSSMCDDGVSCTLDTCNVGGVCGHQAIDSMCSAPTPICDVTQGCIAGVTPQCTSSAECDDAIACTVDSCGVDMMCHHMAVDSSCATNERCDAAMGCVMRHGCATVADCTPVGETWWNFCDGDPMCDTEFGCSFPTPRACHDTDDCTIDTCDRAMGTNGACIFACDTSRPECNCPTTGPSCAGHFQLTPAPTGSCSTVSWDLTHVLITNVDGALTVAPDSLSTPNGPMDTGASATTCPTFTATRQIPGGCTETYTMMATFTDEDHLTGTFDADFAGTCGVALGLCAMRHFSYSFTGVRVP